MTCKFKLLGTLLRTPSAQRIAELEQILATSGRQLDQGGEIQEPEVQK